MAGAELLWNQVGDVWTLNYSTDICSVESVDDGWKIILIRDGSLEKTVPRMETALGICQRQAQKYAGQKITDLGPFA